MPRNTLVRRALQKSVIPVGVTRLAISEVARGRRKVEMHIISLPRMIVRGMAVHAPGTSDHLGSLGEDRPRSRAAVSNRSERRRGLQITEWGLREGRR